MEEVKKGVVSINNGAAGFTVKGAVPVKWRCLWCDGRGNVPDHSLGHAAPTQCPNAPVTGCPGNSLVVFWEAR